MIVDWKRVNLRGGSCGGDKGGGVRYARKGERTRIDELEEKGELVCYQGQFGKSERDGERERDYMSLLPSNYLWSDLAIRLLRIWNCALGIITAHWISLRRGQNLLLYLTCIFATTRDSRV